MVSREYPPFIVGGAGVHTGHLVKYLRRLGVNVKVVAFGDPSFSDNEIKFIKPKSSILERGKTTIASDIRVFEDILRLVSYVKKEIEREYYDVVHVQEPYVGGIISYHKRKVTTIHDTSFGEIKGYLKYPTTQSFKRALFYVTLGYEMEFLSIINSKLIISPSYDVAWELLRVYRVPRDKIRVILNGIEDPQEEVNRDSAREILNLAKDVIIIFTTGQHIGRKRFSTLIHAARHLKVAGLKNFLIILGGEGPLTPFLKRLAEELNVKDIVHFAGWIPNNQLPLYYRVADVFVITSEYEAGPLTMLEAGIRGIPLVVSDSPSGFMMLARENVDCLKFRTGDSVDLARKLTLLIESPDLRREFGKKATEFASRFKWDKIAERTLEVYKELLV
ncbi:MAG: glycosyltransferase family 4 protein [Sulfolobales archaeon]